MMGKRKILADYDKSYLVSRIEKVKGLWSDFFDDYVVIGGENLDIVANDLKPNFVGFGNHKSHFDYMFLTRTFYKQGHLDIFPRIMAGTNLDNFFVRNLLADFNKCNVLWTDRKKMSGKRGRDYIREWERALADTIHHLDNVFHFPDAGRNWGDGVLRKGTNSVGQKVIESPMNPFIVPFVFDYDEIYEAKYKTKIGLFRKKGWPLRAGYYWYDWRAFKNRPKQENKGNAYIWVGEPVGVLDIVGEIGPQVEKIGKKSKLLDSHVRSEISRGLEEIAKVKN